MGYKLKADATNITVNITRELAKEMVKYPEVTWSIVARMAFEKYCNDRKIKRITDTEIIIPADNDKEINSDNTNE
jgi:hypothetical protein